MLAAGDKAIAIEIFQTAWIRIVGIMAVHGATSNFLSDLYHILITSSKDHYRRQRYYMLINEEVNAGDVSKNIRRPNSIEWVMQVLPVGYRHVLILHDVLGYEVKQISQVLEITEGACESQLFNAQKSIRQLLPNEFPFRSCQNLAKQMQVVRSAFNKELLPLDLINAISEDLIDQNLIDNSSQQFSLLKFLLPGVSMLTAFISFK
jgi:DNA-directed RNA polymerase specialized sigma24 family protein